MATLPTRSQQTIVQTIVAGIQGRANSLIDFGKGSPLRAIAEGFAGILLWFQALVLQLLAAMRLSTASGSDVDSFVGDFDVIRLGAQAASGTVTFSRFTAGPSACFIPVGATVRTSDGSRTFAVTANATYPTYSAARGGYILAANVADIVVPVEAQVPGSAGNVTAGQITEITTVIVGIDTVTNGAAFTNGADSESDSALKRRFSAYILGLSRGDEYGLGYAILSTALTVEWTLTENYDYTGAWRPGYYYVVADDGSGAPSAAFLKAVSAAAQAVRPLGNMCSVFAPHVTYALPSMTVTAADGYDHATVTGLVGTAIQNGINALGLGNGLPYSILSSWAYGVPGVSKVSAVLLNGLSGDAASIPASPKVTIKCNTVTVS